MRPDKIAYMTLFILVSLAAGACSGSGASAGSDPAASGAAAPGAANFTLKGSARR
jgi:hypothetical protein